MLYNKNHLKSWHYGSCLKIGEIPFFTPATGGGKKILSTFGSLPVLYMCFFPQTVMSQNG
ncbi:MAG: hypothetical protein LBR79_00990 [Oscillospiraceae bacterium]|nr:hypothetical protein [Oscillospiraceae bacterium]